jgi:hypothetical protein
MCTVRTFNSSYTADLGAPYTADLGAPYGRECLHDETETRGFLEQGALGNKEETESTENATVPSCIMCIAR